MIITGSVSTNVNIHQAGRAGDKENFSERSLEYTTVRYVI